MTLAPAGPDPRPKLEDGRVVGVGCDACGHTSASIDRRCRRCAGSVRPARFGPDGAVWASAAVHLAVDHREPPFTLAYVDLDDGPRILTLVDTGAELDAGTRVRIAGAVAGDIVVGVIADD